MNVVIYTCNKFLLISVHDKRIFSIDFYMHILLLGQSVNQIQRRMWQKLTSTR